MDEESGYVVVGGLVDETGEFCVVDSNLSFIRNKGERKVKLKTQRRRKEGEWNGKRLLYLPTCFFYLLG